MDDGPSWLCRDGMDRKRMVDMGVRLKPLRTAAFVVVAVGLAICSPWLGYWTVGPVILGAAVFAYVDHRMLRSARPEYWMFSGWVSLEVTIAVAVAISGGATQPTIAWLAIPVSTLGARFPLRAIVVGLLIAIALLFAVGFAVERAAVLDRPPLLIAPLAMLIAVAILSVAGMQSDIQHRSEAFIDPLTGCLNRSALNNKLQELAEQSAVHSQPIGLILGDIDHFKQVNDLHGHATGDAVLADVAYTLRSKLRAYDAAYRVGGEEFLVVLPGADLEQASAIAEGLRVAVEATTTAGLNVTMSFGVAATELGEPFDAVATYQEVDHALYEAKWAGRNRVCTAKAPPLAA